MNVGVAFIGILRPLTVPVVAVDADRRAAIDTAGPGMTAVDDFCE